MQCATKSLSGQTKRFIAGVKASRHARHDTGRFARPMTLVDMAEPGKAP